MASNQCLSDRGLILCHIQSSIGLETYRLQWSLKNFSYLPAEEICSPDFYPLTECAFCAIFRKNIKEEQCYFYLCNKSNKKIEMDLDLLILDINDKVFISRSSKFTLFSGVKHDVLPNVKSIWGDLHQVINNTVIFDCSMRIIGNVEHNIRVQKEPVYDSLVKLSEDMKSLYENSETGDITLNIGEEILSAHKSILCARSPVFNKMFKSRMNEQDSNVVKIDDIAMKDFKNLIQFVYTGILPTDEDIDIYALFYAADKYEIMDLRKICENIMLSKLTVENACCTLISADRHKAEKLKSQVLHFMGMNAPSVMATEEWKYLVEAETKLAAEVMNLYVNKLKII